MIYFASDIHLGLHYGSRTPLERELAFVRFLTKIESDCQELFLVGDVFDFWFEWSRSIPKGYVRVLGKLAQMCDKGIKIHFFTGNHDLWLTDYLNCEIGLIIHKEPYLCTVQDRELFIAHGDTFYHHTGVSRLVEIVCRSGWARWVAQRFIHPDIMIRFGMRWSRSSRLKRNGVAHIFGQEEDYLVKFTRQYLAQHPGQNIDYFIFGHLHTPIIYPLNERCSMAVLGEWVENPQYATLCDSQLTLHRFE